MLGSEGTGSRTICSASVPTSFSARLLDLGKSPHLSEPQFPHLANGNNSNSFLRDFLRTQ